MSAYLARLKQLENEKNSHYTPGSEPSKPSKAPFVGFDGTVLGHIEKKLSDSDSPHEPESLQDKQRETRRQKVIAMLAQNPDTKRAIYTDTDSDPDNIILTIALRNAAMCEMLIPKEKYDPFLFLKLIERHGNQTH